MIAEECVQKLLDLPISNPPSERDALVRKAAVLLHDAKNELCYRCGRYKKGEDYACLDCKWRNYNG